MPPPLHHTLYIDLLDKTEAWHLLDDICKQELQINLDLGTIVLDTIYGNGNVNPSPSSPSSSTTTSTTSTTLPLFDTATFISFQASLPEIMQPISKEAHALLCTITNTCALAHSVSRKVRDLDTIKARVKEGLRKVEDIIDLKNCADIVKKAMGDEDYETAAEHIQKYMGFTVGPNNGLEEPVMREGHTHDLIANAEQQLKSLIRTKLDQSLINDKQEEIVRFCKLYATLGMKDEGLTRYCHYLRKLCSNSAEQILKQYLYSTGRLSVGATTSTTGTSSTSTPPPTTTTTTITITTATQVEVLSAAAALTQIFECAAEIIDAQIAVVEENFGSGSAVTMIRNMVDQSNTHTYRLIELFMENHSVSRKLDFATDKSRIPEKDRDPSVLTPTLNEMVSICKSAEFYSRFIAKKVMGLAPTSASSTKKPTNVEVAININSELGRKIQEIISIYISLEEYFMVESMQKAIKMDEQSGDSLTSSMVDYVFFVLQQSIQRAVESHNIYALCASVNHVLRCLDNYKEILMRFFKDQLAKSSHHHVSRVHDKSSHLVALNNIEVSSEYIMKIRSEIESKAERMFAKGEDKEKVKTALSDLQEVSKRYKQILEQCVEQFCQSLRSRTGSLLDLFANVNYEISDQEYANNEINDPFAQVFIAEATAILKPYSSSLTSTNYDLFVHQLVASLAKKLERLLLEKRINHLGALQFDKDLLTISAYFSSVSLRSVRDKLARLSQMANLLTSENLVEVFEIYNENSGNITWRLAPTEVRKVLMRRVDYAPDQIAKLKL